MGCRGGGVELIWIDRLASCSTDVDQTALEGLQSYGVDERIGTAIDKGQEHRGVVPLPGEVQVHTEVEPQKGEVVGCPAQHVHDCDDDHHHGRISIRFDEFDIGIGNRETFTILTILVRHGAGSVQISFPTSQDLNDLKGGEKHDCRR